VDSLDPKQLEVIGHLLSNGNGIATLLLIVVCVLSKLWMKEMRERIELSEKRAGIIEQNNKLIEELRDTIKDLSSNIDKLMLALTNQPPRRRGGQ
jgi:hypothetical protein